MYRAVGRVPQAIKSIFQELQRCCRLLPAPLKTSTGGWGEGCRVKGVRLEDEAKHCRERDEVNRIINE